jgi:hypothetical protein
MSPFENMPIDDYPEGISDGTFQEVERIAEEVTQMKADQNDDKPPPVA